MGPDDFFEDTETVSPWSSEPTITTKLRKDLLNQLRAGPVALTDDLDAAIGLTHLVWDNLTAFGTDGSNAPTTRRLRLPSAPHRDPLANRHHAELPLAGLRHLQDGLVA